MPTTQVNPGDLITAQLMNEILTRLGQHDALLGQIGGAGPQTIVVPAVYGRTLTDARAIITAPTAQLAFGSVIDAAGNVINPNLSQSLLLPVIGQMPPAGTRVAPQTSVDLLVAATSSSGPSQPLPTVNSITQSSAAVGSSIDIFGANFASLFSLNTVRFNGQPGTVSASSNTQHLIVTVPNTIPGAPNAPGGPPLAGVAVSVSTPAGIAANAPTITVTAPNPSAPQITSTNPAPPTPAIVTGSLVIAGNNFSATPVQNTVRIDGITASVTSASSQSLTVTVPLISGLNTIPSTRNNVPVVVTVNAIASNTAIIHVTRLS